jgi:hypothetical protein
MEENSLESIRVILTQMKDKQDEMDEMLRDIDKTLTQLNQTVIGNPVYGQKGLIAELDEVKRYVDKDKMIKNKVIGGLTVIGVIWTMLYQYITHLLKN